jgi:hypothetical protein
VVVLGFVNFVAFLVESNALGGDGLNGYEAGGHYYVASHGTYTEVPQTLWTISRIHAVGTLVSWPLVLLSMAFLGFGHVLPLMMTGSASGQSDVRVADIRASGAPVWSGSPGGRVGSMNATRAMLDVAVYPGGIVVKPRFLGPFAILVHEIRSVRLGRSLVTKTIEIDHAGIDAASPLVIFGGPDSPQAVAILALVEERLNSGDLASSGPGWR